MITTIERIMPIIMMCMLIFFVSITIGPGMIESFQYQGCEPTFVGIVEDYTYAPGGFGAANSATVQLTNGEKVVVTVAAQDVLIGDSIENCAGTYRVVK